MDLRLSTSRASLRAAERKWRKSRDPSYLFSYQSLLAAFSSAITSTKREYSQTKINKSMSNLYQLFSIFSSLLSTAVPPPSLLHHCWWLCGVLRWEDCRHPELLHHHPPHPTPSLCPLSVPHSLSPPLSPLILSPHRHWCFSTPPLPPPYHLPPRPYPLIPPSVNCTTRPPIHHLLVNSSLSSGCFPSSFKKAYITPLLKKPLVALDPSTIQNYHLVSLLPFISKTLKRATSNQLSAFFSQNNLLDPHQSGFRPAHSTETALLAVKESLQTAQAASLSSVLILLDLSAAFDTVNHSTLCLQILSSLAATGICAPYGPRLDQVLPLWSLLPGYLGW